MGNISDAHIKLNSALKCNRATCSYVSLFESTSGNDRLELINTKLMKSNFWKVAAGVGSLCAVNLMVMAAPLKRADVAAEPAWVVHLDCDALRPTTVGRYILSEMDKPENKAKVAGFQAQFGFDLRTQLHGITLFGTGTRPEEGVMMVYADFDPAHLVSLAESATDYQSDQHGDNTIHSWIDDNKKAKNGGKPRIYAAIQGNHVIFGQREESVAMALDVAAKKESSLAGSKSFPELGLPGNAHVVEAAAQKLNLPDSNPKAAILKLSQSIKFVLGERKDQINGEVTLVADNAEVAGHVFSIAQGLLALAKLQTDKPESVKVANAIDLKQDGSRVVGSLAMPATELVDIMKADAARKAKRNED